MRLLVTPLRRVLEPLQRALELLRRARALELRSLSASLRRQFSWTDPLKRDPQLVGPEAATIPVRLPFTSPLQRFGPCKYSNLPPRI